MNWFFLSISAPLLWAIVNHLDKLLLEKYFKRGGVPTLLIFSSIIGIVAAPFLFFLSPNVLDISFLNFAILLVNGIFAGIALWLYLLALSEDEASIVVVFYQLIPVFGYVLGYFLLGEILTQKQLIAMALIILGAAVISFEIDQENKFKLRKKTAILMTLASLVYALDSVLFKLVAIKENFWTSLFWEYVALGFMGIVLLAVSSYRKDFVNMIKTNSIGIFSLNILNEIIYIGGNFLFAYSYLLAPVALVLLVNSYQPLLVLLIGIFLTIFLPKLGTENIQIKHITQKICAVIIVGIGTYLLFI